MTAVRVAFQGAYGAFSEDAALAQCDRYPGALDGAVVKTLYDTAGAAQHVAPRVILRSPLSRGAPPR